MSRTLRHINPSESARHLFAWTLRELRVQAGSSLQGFAKRLGKSDSYLSAVELAEARCTRAFAEACDELLDARGKLVNLWVHADQEWDQITHKGAPSRRRGSHSEAERVQADQAQAVRIAAVPAGEDVRPGARVIWCVDGTRPAAGSIPVAWVPPGEGLAYAERQLVMAAANQAGEHAGRAGAGNLEGAALEQLHDHVVRLAHAYLTGPMLPVFGELVAVRNRTYDLLERTQRLEQRHDLYLIAGLLSCLLAGTSYDLGYPEAGIEQARAAQIYGELIGHESLRAYAYSQLSMFFHLEGQYRRAVEYARAGQAHAAPGSPMLRLRSLEALASSRLGRADEATATLEMARLARDEVTGADDLHDRTGGMFTSTDAKQAYMAGMTYIHLGQADKAVQEASRAIELWTTGPAAERAEGALAVARIDLVTAYLMLGELDAAIDSTAPLLTVAPEQRTTIVLKRLSGFQEQLATPPYVGSPQAESLGQRIEDFRATATIPELPSRSP